MYAIVIEWEDGSIDVNGPYHHYERDKAVLAARQIGRDLMKDRVHVDEGGDWESHHVEGTRPGCQLESVGGDTVDVYIVGMSTPIDNPVS